MKEYIECRHCDSANCSGCNVLTLSKMLHDGKFDCIMDEHHSINPAADVVERKRGRWKYWEGWCSNWNRRIDDAKCSICGYRHPTVWPTGEDRHTPNLLFNYCPNCGADMREVP